jgi:predicted acyl esterase
MVQELMSGRLESVWSFSFGPLTRIGEVTSLFKVELVLNLSAQQDKLAIVLIRLKLSAESRKMTTGCCSSGSQKYLKARRGLRFLI